ncbi:high choriolytic enzyme 2-like [Neolamprologus brichardi]|uniref:high choriolytic enzyme 2-like n=1 Tax=Neolamprologus brichardi TaxID=32507 RepID=UPI0003EC693A|nr:high choriolytic enzyme 2-like [Neolamprologus brichardi]
MSPSVSLLLLLGLSQAHPLMEERGGGESQVEEDHTIDITTRILTANNGSNEILLEGDILLPKSRNAIKCQSYQSCLWQKDNNGLVTIPFTISSEYSSGERTAFSINGRETITPIPNPNVQIGQRQGMSSWDIKRINLLTAFSINGRETITPIPNPNVQIGQRQGMSSWDIRRINLLYGC